MNVLSPHYSPLNRELTKALQSVRLGISFGIVLILTVNSAWSAPAKAVTLNVKDFGAKGDGVTDDYDAMQAAAVAICNAPGATLVYPAGVYRINRYRITAGPQKNKVLDIRYVGCSGNTITGSGASIEVKGDFRRAADLNDGGYWRSYSNSLIPFAFINSSGFHLTGFEINGNVNKMSRDARVVEGTGTGITTTNCKDYVLENLFVHHFATDGIHLGANSELADQRATVSNVTSTHNARQGLSIAQARQVTVVNSVFADTGRTGGYGSHAPAAGVDVEPGRRPPEEDVATGLIVFDHCRFEENIGSQFVSGWPGLVESITVQNSTIKATLADTSGTAFMNAPRTGITTNNTFELASGHWIAAAVRRPDQYPDIAHLTFSHNTIRLGSNSGILPPMLQAPVDLLDNDIRIENDRADLDPLRLSYFNLIEGNRFFVAGSGYSGLGYTVLYERGKTTVRKNSYDTDRNSSGAFTVYYGPGMATDGENFLNPTHFQPVYQNQQ